MESIENKIENMTDGQIAEILFNKEEWSETAYNLAVNQANIRGISLEKPPVEVEVNKKEKAESSEEPLDFKWKWMIAISPFGLFTLLLHEKFHIDGKTRKVRESRQWMLM